MTPTPRTPGHSRWVIPGLALFILAPLLAGGGRWFWFVVIPLVALTVAGIVSVVHRKRLIAVETARRAALSTAQEQHAWEIAKRLRRDLPDQPPRNTVKVWDLIPNKGEVFIVDAPVRYARYYGRNVTYTTSSAWAFGNPLFVAATLAGSAIGNASVRSQAEALAREQWREQQTVRLVVTNQRLCCMVGRTWLDFYYSAMTAVYPHANDRILVCTFSQAEPLLIQGMWAPAAAVVTTYVTQGVDALLTHPGLRSLSEPTV